MTGIGAYALSAVTAVLAEIVVLVIIAVRARGRARRVGLIGAVILLLGAVVSGALSLVGPLLITRLDLPISVYSLLNVPVTLLHGVGVVLIAVAIGTHSREDRAGAQPPTQPSGWMPGPYPR